MESGPLKHRKAKIVSIVDVWGTNLSSVSFLSDLLGFCSAFASQMSFIKDAKIKHAQKKANKIKLLYSFPDERVLLFHFTKPFYIAEQSTLRSHERR